MKKYKNYIILFNLLIILILINLSIYQKENVLTHGDLVLLELAPVDPRSLMQGDYMQLDYAATQDIGHLDSIPKRGFCIVRLDSNGVGESLRLQKNAAPLSSGEYAIPYTVSNWQLSIGADSFFFEEGQAEKFESAKYGGLRIDKRGNNVLIGLFDENRKQIK